jgi:hypothetical protein
MAEDYLQIRVGDFDSFIVGVDLVDEHVSYERVEEHKVFTGEQEVWRVKVTKDLISGASYWSYLGKIDGLLL